MGVDDDDGVAVPARRLLPHLVDNDVMHEGGLAHAGAGDVEVVAVEQVVGEAYLAGLARRRVPHERSPFTPPGDGRSTRAPDRSTRGVSSLAPGGCQRAAASRTPRTLRLPRSPGPAGCSDGTGETGRILPT